MATDNFHFIASTRASNRPFDATRPFLEVLKPARTRYSMTTAPPTIVNMHRYNRHQPRARYPM